MDSTKIVEPEDIQVLEASNDAILTLVTCYPFNFVGSAPKRFIVRARRVHDGERTMDRTVEPLCNLICAKENLAR